MVWGPLRPANNPINSDKFSLGPRFGFAYTLDNSGDFVVRGGYGISFQGLSPTSMENSISSSPYLPTVFTYTKQEVLKYGLKYPVTLPQMNALTAQISGTTPRVAFRFDPDFHAQYAMNYTLGIQRALARSLMLEVEYVGNRGVKREFGRTYNLPDRLTGIKPNP